MLFMINYQKGDVVILEFTYSDGVTTKTRPALVLLDTGDADIVVARITTTLYDTPYDVTIEKWNESGLFLPSVARLHKLNTSLKSLVTLTLGKLMIEDYKKISEVLKTSYGNW